MRDLEMLEKLQALNESLLKFSRVAQYLEKGFAQENAQKLHEVIEELGKLPGVPRAAKIVPIFPPDPTEYEKAKTDAKQSGLYTLAAVAVVVFGVILGLSTASSGNMAVPAAATVLGGIATFGLNGMRKDRNEQLKKKETAYQEALAKSQKSIKDFREAIAGYEEDVAEGVSCAKAYARAYKVAYQKNQQILDDHYKVYREAQEEQKRLLDEIMQHDYISQDYLHHVPTLIGLLQSGRADSYKEALNMAIEEERLNKIEATRQEEEARRLAAIERQAEEQRLHNWKMQQQQEARAQAEETEKEEKRMLGVHRCWQCANYGGCSRDLIKSGAGLTCASWRKKS